MSVKVICHMISSVDGRLATARWSVPYRPADVTEVYEGVASGFHADGWIIGRTTMAEYADCVTEHASELLPAAPAQMPEPFLGNRGGRMIAVAIDPKAKLLSSDCTLPTGEHLVMVLTPRAAPEHLAKLRAAGVSYVFERDENDLAGALEALEALFGVKTMLLEGGGVINGAFLAAGLIDELSVLIYPAVDGLAGVSPIINFLGKPDDRPAAKTHLELLAVRAEKNGVVALRYALHNEPND